MDSVLLPIAHIQQRRDGECLPVCVAMLLSYLGVALSYRRVLALLGTRPEIGTPTSNIRNIEQTGLAVKYQRGTLRTLHMYLSGGHPVIAFVSTGHLPHWKKNVEHAVVVAGMDNDRVYLNDPELSSGPVATPLGDFDLAWLERDEMYAVITRRTE